MLKLLPGLIKFQSEIYTEDPSFYECLANGQSPDAIFITCSDSRIDPALLTQTKPGSLFVIRNAGNIVPAHSPSELSPGEEATIEYAVNHLKVKNIVVCGHSSCGAMQGLMNLEGLDMPAVKKWLHQADKTLDIVKRDYERLDEKAKVNAAIQVNVLVQLENLKSLPCLSKKIESGDITLHGWIYDIASGDVFILNAAEKQFRALVKTAEGFDLNSGRPFLNS